VTALRPTLDVERLAIHPVPHYPAAMNDSRFSRVWRAIADEWSFQMGTIGCWLERTPETPEDQAIRLEGERIRRAFPWIDLLYPGASQTR